MTRRRKLLLLSLIPLGLVLTAALVLATNWGLALAIRIAAASMPGQLSVAAQQGSLLGPIRLQNVRYTHDRFSIAIRQLELDWHSLALLSGRVAISRLQTDDIRVDIKPAPKHRAAAASFRLLLPFVIDVQHARVKQLLIHHANASKPVQITQLDFSAVLKGSDLTIHRFDIDAYRAKATLAGTLVLQDRVPLKLMVDASYPLPNQNTVHAQGTLKGDLQTLELSQDLSGLFQAKLDATIHDVIHQLHWQAQLNLDQFDLQKLMAKSQSVLAQGKITASGDIHRLQLDSHLNLHSKRLGLLELQTSASSDTRFNHYQFHSQGQFTGVDLPVATFRARGEGDHQQLELTQVYIDTLKGKVQGQTRVGWQPFQIHSRLSLQQLHTGMLSSQWPGQISGELTLQTQMQDSKHPIRFTLHKVKGDIRAYPLQAELDGSWEKYSLRLNTMRIALGSTRVDAHGRLAQQWDLAVKVHSDNLNSLLPLAKGSFHLEGHLGGNAQAPRVTLQVDASQLAYTSTSLEKLALRLDMGLGKQAAAQADLQIDSLQGQAGQWDTLHLQTAGSNAAHTITLAAANKTASIQLAGHGVFVPWRWRGQLDTFRYQQEQAGLWQLQKPVSMDLAKDAYTVSPLCLVQKTTQLCAEAQWHDRQHKLNLHASAFPLALLAPWLPSTLQLQGQLNMQAALQMTTAHRLQGQLSLSSPDKSVVLHFTDTTETLALGASSLSAKLDDRGLYAKLHLPLAAGGGLDSEATLPNWSPLLSSFASQAIRASFRLDRVPADVMTRFVPELASAHGQLHADLAINGSLSQPRMRGEAKWQDGSVLVPRLGIHIRQVNFQLKSTQTNTLAFVLSAESGKGDVRLEGQTHLIPEQGWPTHATLTSHRLEVSNIPEAYILVDSKIDLALQGSTITVDGDVTVPQARLHPSSLPEGAVPLSRDVVIVHEAKSSAKPQRWLINSRLRVHLGDQVTFNGFGIRGKLRGQVLLNDEPGKLLMAQGELGIVDGTYRLRGQDLSIRRGRLMFSNTFIDDPALDVEAVRTVGTITAGVRLKGTLKQPQLSVFSEPTMSESDALAYLITGHSMSQSTSAEGRSVSNTASALGLVAGDYLAQEIGGRLGLDELRLDVEQSTQNTALVMGKYLSPRLYLRYFSGIVESSSIVQLQYQLSRRVQIQTEGGYRGSQSVTGGDIYFTIEY